MVPKVDLDTLLVGTRVLVSDGGSTKYLGEGTYLGLVRTFYFQSQKGITSGGIRDPEHMPTDKEYVNANKKGMILKTYEKMPKMELEGGSIIYGMDCWWTPIKNGVKLDKQKDSFIKRMHDRRQNYIYKKALLGQYKRKEISEAELRIGLVKYGVSKRYLDEAVASANGIKVIYQ